MLSAYELIKTQLEGTGIADVFADLYPLARVATKTYPYIVFNMPNTGYEDYCDINALEIDIFDNKLDLVEIENLADLVDSIFRKMAIQNSDMFANSFRDKPHRLKLDDDANGIQRRQMRYVFKCWYKNNINY